MYCVAVVIKKRLRRGYFGGVPVGLANRSGAALGVVAPLRLLKRLRTIYNSNEKPDSCNNQRDSGYEICI